MRHMQKSLTYKTCKWQSMPVSTHHKNLTYHLASLKGFGYLHWICPQTGPSPILHCDSYCPILSCDHCQRNFPLTSCRKTLKKLIPNHEVILRIYAETQVTIRTLFPSSSDLTEYGYTFFHVNYQFIIYHSFVQHKEQIWATKCIIQVCQHLPYKRKRIFLLPK